MEYLAAAALHVAGVVEICSAYYASQWASCVEVGRNLDKYSKSLLLLMLLGGPPVILTRRRRVVKFTVAGRRQTEINGVSVVLEAVFKELGKESVPCESWMDSKSGCLVFAGVVPVGAPLRHEG